MSITDELRKYARDWNWFRCTNVTTQREIEAIADRIDAAHADGINDGLPTDVDGVPIRVGDWLVEGKASPDRVKALMLDCDGWSVNFGLGWCIMKYHKWHHVKPDTFESIIEDAFYAGESGELDHGSYEQTFTTLVARCKALCERTREEE